MMILNKFPDKYLIETDPRREDPLFYYHLKDCWQDNSSIGFAVNPLYEEGDSKEVYIEIYNNHLSIFNALNINDRGIIVKRVISTLIKEYRHWERVGLNFSLLFNEQIKADIHKDVLIDFSYIGIIDDFYYFRKYNI